MKNYQSSAMRNNAVLLNAGKFSKKFTMFGLAAAITAVSMLSSCKKDSDDIAAPSLKASSGLALSPAVGASLPLTNVTTGTVSQISAGVYKVTNYYVAQSVYDPANPHQANGLYYFDFSLNDNKLGTSPTAPPSTAWDVSFSGTGNADIKINSVGAIKFLNENFATASARSASSAWAAGTAVATTATFGHNRTIMTTPLAAPDYLAAASGTTIKGWWNYYFGNHQVIATTDLTVLIQDNLGDTYAVHMISVYNNDTPTGTPFPSNFSYLTFEYKKLS